jgi:DUF1365 family protein
MSVALQPAPARPAPVRDGSSNRWGSALYEGTVRHRRHGPVEHEFETRVLMALLDLSEIDRLVAAMPLWSSGRGAPVQVRRRDWFDGTERPLAPAIRDLVEDRSGRRPAGRIRMLTQLRTLGWLFNPLTIYFCDDELGRPHSIVLEVTNTPWHERQWYVLDAHAPAPFDKALHVSPFLPMDVDYRFWGDPPGEQIRLGLDVVAGDATVFDADLRLERIQLTPLRALAALACHPGSTLKVSAAIRYQAARLWAKGAPYHRHPGSA